MSHFTVLVIGENPEEQLAPFQENNIGDCPKEYLEFEEDEDYDLDEETGKKGFWENPNAKWDWYELGGRWTGFFKSKIGVLSVTGNPGLMTKEAEDGYSDQSIKKDIDFEYMRNEAANEAMQRYDYAISIIGELPVNEKWEDIRSGGNTVTSREIYWSQARCKAWKEKEIQDRNWPFGFMSSPDDFLISREDYIANARASAISTHAVIKDGKWYERGNMGWFGIVSEEKDTWEQEFEKLIDCLPEDTLLSVYDCHI